MPATLHLVPMSDAPDPSEVLRNVSALETAEDRAFRRGQDSAKDKAQLASHEHRLNAINGSIERTASALLELKAAFEQNIAIAQARAEDAKQTAEKQVSTRTFVLGLIGAVVAIGSLLAATGHA